MQFNTILKFVETHTLLTTFVLCLCVWFMNHRSMCLKYSQHPANTAQWLVYQSVRPICGSISSFPCVSHTHRWGAEEQPTIVNWPTVYGACWHTISVITWASCQLPALIKHQQTKCKVLPLPYSHRNTNQLGSLFQFNIYCNYIPLVIKLHMCGLFLKWYLKLFNINYYSNITTRCMY